jgi:diguanylate cyclase (GGDEF)-like protein
MASRSTPLRAALTHAAEVRSHAARDRAQAAEDRAQAAADREFAADLRDSMLDELHRAHRDELTGAYRRGAGEEALQDGIERARRSDSRLVLAFVDVDGLREVNNREGHTVGDALLQNVVVAIQSKIRSYEPVVRFGGDEFVCAITDLDLGQAGERFAEIHDSLAESSPCGGISVGLAELRDDDTLDGLIERADTALLSGRAGRNGVAG